MVKMDKLERLHETKIPVIVETTNGALDDTIDLEAMSEDELFDIAFSVPQAMQELAYRDALATLSEDN